MLFIFFSELATVGGLGCGNKEQRTGVAGAGRGICAGVHTVGGLKIEEGSRGRHGSDLEEAWSRGERFASQVVIVAR
jgi:hypothetical protein